MKKPKISLDKDKLQAFFLNHVEKIILAVVVGLMLLLIWRGFSLPHLDDKMSPQGLVSESETTRQYVEDPERWNEVKLDRLVPIEVERKVQEVLKKTDPLAYLLPSPLNRPDFPKLSPRQDPELFPPINLVVRPVFGPLASYLKPTEVNYVDPLYPSTGDEDDPLKRQAAKKKRDLEAKKKAEALAGEYSADGAMPGAGGRTKAKRGRGNAGGEYSGDEGGATPRGRRSAGSAMSEDSGYGSAGGYGGMAGYGQLGEGGLTAGGLYPQAEMHGYIPQQPDQTIARNVASVTLMALVPIQKQTEEFDEKFTEALDYDPRRDIPLYLDYRVQRADVTALDPNDPIDEALWKPLDSPKKVLTDVLGDQQNPNAPTVGLYAGVPLDVVDPTYLDYEGGLTHPAPPYLQRDIWDLLTHPEVPLATFNLYGDSTAPGAGATPATAPGAEDAPSLPANFMPGRASAGGEDGGYGMAGGMRGGYGMAGGSAMGGGMAGGYMPRPGGYGGMRGSDEGSADSGYGGGYGSAAMSLTPPKFKLIRYTDFTVQRGKKYRYRVALFVHDPNHPMFGFVPPSMAGLHGDVQKRVKEQDAKDVNNPKDPNTGMPRKTSWRFTAWSEPSPIAELPAPARVFAVKVKPKAPTKIKGVEVSMAETEAEALAVVFDPSKVADIPAANTKVARGAVLNFSQDKLKVIHPVTKEVVEFTTKYDVATNALVADLMGGETIKAINPSASAQPLTALGELLVVDSNGNLHVQNEAEDVENYRRYAVPDPPKTSQAANPEGGTPLPGGTPQRGRRGAQGDF
jgi:hypothetical protein